MRKSRRLISGILLLGFLFPLWSQNGTEDPVDMYARGLQYQMRGEYFAAIEVYKDVLRYNRNYLEPIIGLAESFYALGEYEESLAWLEEAQTFGRARINLRNLKGKIHLATGAFDRAEEEFRAVLESEPNNLDAQFGLAELEIALGKEGLAVQVYEDALKISPENRKALLSLVLIYDSLEEGERAAFFLEQALRYHSGNILVRYLAAMHYYRERNFNKAREQLLVAVSLEPDHLDVLLMLCEVYLHLGEFDRAVPILEHALTLDPSSAAIWYLFGIVKKEMGSVDEAIVCFQRAVMFDPQDRAGRLVLESLVMDRYDLEDSEREIYSRYHFEQADELRRRNYVTQALEEYRRGLMIYPYSTEGRLGYADLLRTAGWPGRALSELQVLMSLGESNADLLDQIAIQTSLLEETLALREKIDAYELDGFQLNLDLFFRNPPEPLYHSRGEVYYSEYLHALLTGARNLNATLFPSGIDEIATAFKLSRESGRPYFCVLSYEEQERSFLISAVVYSSRTGTELARFRTYKTGSDRIISGLRKTAEKIEALFPVAGTIFRRDFETVLVDRGALDEIAVEDRFDIVRRDKPQPAKTRVGLEFQEEDILGTLQVVEVDETVALALITEKPFFDLISVGDLLIASESPENTEISGITGTESGVQDGYGESALFQAIRSIPD